MSFTDEQPRVATEKQVTRWGGSEESGKRFRCYLCGYKFKIGDYWRWVQGTKVRLSNLLVCKKCDGPDVLKRWKKANKEWKKANEELKTKFWWALS